MTECLHIIVKGRVQGVYFRAYTQKQAIKLNLSGFARNLPDGHVEIVASGEAAALRELVSWCHKGPMLAKVTDVIVSARQHDEIFNDFEIRFGESLFLLKDFFGHPARKNRQKLRDR